MQWTLSKMLKYFLALLHQYNLQMELILFDYPSSIVFEYMGQWLYMHVFIIINILFSHMLCLKYCDIFMFY